MSVIKRLVKRVIPQEWARSIGYLIHKDKSVRVIFEKDKVVVSSKGKVDGAVPVLYHDGEPNFGDLIGPYLVSKISKKPVYNIFHSRFPGFMTVGSILQRIDRPGMVVWGSGLIEKPKKGLIKRLRKYKPNVLSVRGTETANILNEAGIVVREMDALGDPALIMPLFYQATIRKNTARVLLCPHFTHKRIFYDAFADQKEVGIVDVQKDLELVIDSICSSAVCISTSLHGIIISQAYGVPWIWLEIIDNNVKGDDFKFRDFFSTLETSQVTHVKIKSEDLAGLDCKSLASKAAIPEKKYNEELILNVFKKYLYSCNGL